jgi:hypothetical protein
MVVTGNRVGTLSAKKCDHLIDIIKRFVRGKQNLAATFAQGRKWRKLRRFGGLA